MLFFFIKARPNFWAEIEWGHWAMHFITFWFMNLCQFWSLVELILAYILWVDLTVNLVWRQQAFHDCQLIFISSFTYSSSWEVLSGCSCKTEYSEDNNMEIEVMRSRAGSEIIKLSDITRSCHEFSVFYGYKGLRQKSCSLTKWSLWRS